VNERTLEILVLPDGRKYQILAQSPSGKAEATAQPPKNIRNDILELQSALLRSSSLHRGQAASHLGLGADEKMVEELGGKLYSFLFADDIASFYRKSLQDAIQAGEKLRIKLRVDKLRELSRVPWEALYDVKTRTFLSAELKTLFTRAVDATDTAIRKPKKLHMLGMIAGPTSFGNAPLAPLDVDLEKIKIERALEPLRADDKVTVAWTISGSYRDFRRRLRSPDCQTEGWTIFHFIGHGDFDESIGKGFLIFEQAGGSAGEARYPETLTPLLTDTGGPQLVILNACNGARSGSGDLFSSTAAALALAGVPAVIAMQFPVSDGMAIAFSEYFYTYLAEGYSIHQALAQTRIDLRGRRMAEWISPVLYMQSSDGQILTL
jgi:CHAT domain-containing protein